MSDAPQADPWLPVHHADAPAHEAKPKKPASAKPTGEKAAPTSVPLTLQMTLPPEIADTLAEIADGQREMIEHLAELVEAQHALAEQIKRLIQTRPTHATQPDQAGSAAMES